MTTRWTVLCEQADLIEGAGIAAMLDGQQLALFYVPESEQKVFAISNWDPIGKANVLSRGLLANLKDQWSVASPLYKQHYELLSGQCLEEEGVQIPTWSVKLETGKVLVACE
ncbi:nitrite reductase small subunit NirD [Marinomonas posidonica]|uniref:Nitrite reductase (NAD(P)H), small subunit n=1 Tax=Marinomonas posidonica (strain CECT 7376 / NCIMB 14433 / IVIA-Po-181) TaxID=491952 RepID=F6CW02_MARPP|nr:nitrite reductase small subunit NirD [Marinomonas posidonica]AEF54301.1 nitrite reductase (NAD(P)H), small subunit [Marinomonas posidonica IVIA-Po-181]